MSPEKEKSVARFNVLVALVECANDAIMSMTTEHTIATWNAGAERLYGYTADEAIGASILIIVPPDHAAELTDVLDRVGRGERVPAFDTRRRRKDGRLIDVSLSISPIMEGEKLVGASAIARETLVRERQAHTDA
jgi:PAS domain S-box-containing protein